MVANVKLPILAEQELLDLTKIMNLKYAPALNGRFFSIETSKDAMGIYADVTMQSPDSRFYYPVSARMTHSQPVSEHEGALLLLDYCDLYFAEYLRDDAILLPIEWTNYSFEGIDFQLRGQISNLMVEGLADEWLEKHEHHHGPGCQHDH